MFDSYEVVNAYTDSLSDLPMLKIAKNIPMGGRAGCGAHF